jgi:hypothetical protein
MSPLKPKRLCRTGLQVLEWADYLLDPLQDLFVFAWLQDLLANEGRER